MRLSRVPLLVPALLLALVPGSLGTSPATAAGTAGTTAAAAPSDPSRHTFRQLTTDADFAAGTVGQGVRVSGGALRLAAPATKASYAGKRWRTATWTSAWSAPGHSFEQLVPSWEATTPVGTHVRVLARVATGSGSTSGWKVLGRWAGHDTRFERSSAGTQADGVASVATDTVRGAAGTSLAQYQLRVELWRTAASKRTPVLRSVQAVASHVGQLQPVSTPLLGAQSLAVPQLSQMVHRGRYPQYGGGGQAWCSPTSLAMVLGYHGALPAPRSYAWVDRRRGDRVVPAVARSVYDHGYRGAGNWAFNTAYAANRTGSAFVTRLASLQDAERFVAAGIPLVASISFRDGALAGAPIRSTAGHLVVIRGFTATGDVLVNDPAAPSNASVGRTYDRAQFERAWQGSSAGLVYVVSSPSHPLPQGRAIL